MIVSTLTDTPYLPATPTRRIVVQQRPGSTKFKAIPAQDAIGFERYTDTQKRPPAKRGKITGLSKKSKLRLIQTVHSLNEIIGRPDLFITATYPGEYRSVLSSSQDVGTSNAAPSGRTLAKHVQELKKRMERYFSRDETLKLWSALWFIEFQKRGAPHIHLLVFGEGFRRSNFDLKEFNSWLKRAWAEIVDHKDPLQLQRHRLRGARAEWSRNDHFGYALALGRKYKQKLVPNEFVDVGRLWGLWKSPLGAPETSVTELSQDELSLVGQQLEALTSRYSPRFADRLGKCFELTASSPTFGFSLTVLGIDVRALIETLLFSRLSNPQPFSQASLEANFVQSQHDALFAKLGKRVPAEFVTQTDAEGTEYGYKGEIIITEMPIKHQVGEIVTSSVSFKGDGPLEVL